MSAQLGQGIWNRRELLAAGCAAAGMFGLGRFASAAGSRLADHAEETIAPSKWGSRATRSAVLPPERPARPPKALAASKKLGIHYWESYPAHVPMDLGMEALQAIKREIEDAGVEVVGYGVVPFGKDADANRRTFEFAKRLGIMYLSADPDPAAFDDLDKLVEKYDIAIGIHNHGPGHRYGKIETIASAIKDHHPKIGCCVDTGHFLLAKVDPVDAVETFGTRVYGVHLKDVKDARNSRSGQGRPPDGRTPQGAGP